MISIKTARLYLKIKPRSDIAYKEPHAFATMTLFIKYTS
jgi:hypothetical protein